MPVQPIQNTPPAPEPSAPARRGGYSLLTRIMVVTSVAMLALAALPIQASSFPYPLAPPPGSQGDSCPEMRDRVFNSQFPPAARDVPYRFSLAKVLPEGAILEKILCNGNEAFPSCTKKGALPIGLGILCKQTLRKNLVLEKENGQLVITGMVTHAPPEGFYPIDIYYQDGDGGSHIISDRIMVVDPLVGVQGHPIFKRIFS